MLSANRFTSSAARTAKLAPRRVLTCVAPEGQWSSAGVKQPSRGGKHFLHLDDFTKVLLVCCLPGWRDDASLGLCHAPIVEPEGTAENLNTINFVAWRTQDELQNMLDLGAKAKNAFYARDETYKPFAGQTMAMIFTKPSARTRVSFETVR